MLCQKPVRSDIQHFIAASAMAALTLDLIMICILQSYLNTKSLKGVLIPPECSLNWKVQEKTRSLIRSDFKKKKKKKKKEDWSLRILDVLIVGILTVYSETCGLICSKTYVLQISFL